jgi:hypothetical protein
VRNEVTGAGIPGVHVVLFTRQAVLYETDTDASGSFLVTGVAPGSYQARLEKNGYSFATDQGTAVIGAASDSARMNVTMSGSVALRGRVVDADGKLVKGSSVRILDFQTGSRSTEGPEFEFKDVRPGYYTLVAVPPAGSELAPAYYPSAIDAYGAVRIAVLGDRDLDGYDIRMETADTFQVSGKILDETGKPLQNARVTLQPVIRHNGRMTGGSSVSVYPASESNGAAEQDLVSKDGTFSFKNVRKGDWTIAAMRLIGNDVVTAAMLRQGSVRVTVDRSDVEDLEIRPAALMQITGSIEWEGGPPRQAMVLFSSATGLNTDLARGGGGNKDGTFTLSLEPGRGVYISTSEFTGYYLASVTMGGQEVLGMPVDILTAPPPIHVVMKRATGTVRGKADPGTSFVMLIPAQSERLGFGRQVFPAADGSFEVKDLAPGAYTIAAFFAPRSLDPAVLEKARTVGVHIQVENSSPANVELRTVRWLQ